MPVGVSDGRIRLYLETNDQPVELVDLTLAFASFARQYRRFLTRTMEQDGKKIAGADAKLYIAEIKTGSIDAWLSGGSDFMGGVVSVLDYVKTFVEFTGYVRATVSYLRGILPERPPLNKRDCDDFKDFVNVVAKLNKGRLNMQVATFAKDDEKTFAQFTFDQQEAIEAQKGAIKEIEQLEKEGHADYEAVAMTWFQSRIGEAKESGRTGDRAIIDDIFPGKDLPVYFVGNTQNDKNKMLEDPFNHVYIVDVNVTTASGIPRAYTIVKLHDILPKDDSQS